jgi:catechol 2,3-dioxygenase-like lactoylglutathione lyase family enzyme
VHLPWFAEFSTGQATLLDAPKSCYIAAMFIGTHVMFYSADPDADRAFMRDVLGFPFVDTGHNWLIFKLPSAESGVHPLEGPNIPAKSLSSMLPAQVFMMVADIEAARSELAAKGAATEPALNEGWGLSTNIFLPSGARIGLYQPLHPTALEL